MSFLTKNSDKSPRKFLTISNSNSQIIIHQKVEIESSQRKKQCMYLKVLHHLLKELTLLKPIHRKSKYIMELINFQPTCKINKPEKMHIFHFKLLLRTRAFVLIAQLKTHLGMLKFSQSSQMFIQVNRLAFSQQFMNHRLMSA